MNLNLFNQFPVVRKLYCFYIFTVVNKVETNTLVNTRLCLNPLLLPVINSLK